MIKFDINDEKITYCYVTDDNVKDAIFNDNVAVVKINIVKHDGCEYESYGVLGKKHSEHGNFSGYFLECECKILWPSEDTINIERRGNHFIIERLAHNFERTKSWIENFQVDYVLTDEKKVFVERSKIPGATRLICEKAAIIASKHSDKLCLFSLEKSDIQSMEFSCIDDIDGKSFLVTDTIYLEEDETFRDRLMFKMDDEGNRISPVYIRSKEGFTDDKLDYHYLLIKERRLNELKEEYNTEKNTEKSLRRG